MANDQCPEMRQAEKSDEPIMKLTIGFYIEINTSGH